MAKAKRKKTVLFDTSRYISLRMAVWLALGVLVVCVLVGLQYSGFQSLLSVRVRPITDDFEFEEEDPSTASPFRPNPTPQY